MSTVAVRCPGCGEWFRGERGLRAHQSKRFQAMACRPVKIQPEQKVDVQAQAKNIYNTIFGEGQE